MRRSDFATLDDLGFYIAQREEHYTDQLFHALYRNAGNLHAWYDEANYEPQGFVLTR